MEKTDFMQHAIDLCQRKMDEGAGGYCASLVVKDGEVIGEGWNDVINNSDPTGHCEIHALRAAGKKLGTWDLSGCDLYTTWELCCASTRPAPMFSSAANWFPKPSRRKAR
ncbi:MAG: nucleoside deaminase [Rhodospirillaceae bacterium]|mgnify:FL=1|nr:nucleoside deaminase [Rhodospirillaceae bacterium]